MGSLSRVRVVILLLLLVATGVGIYREPAATGHGPSSSLATALAHIPGWERVSRSALSPKIVAALKLDDYLQASYSNGHGEVALYIGYYNSAGKVGAAHNPLVCFPGQGWQLKDRTKGILTAQPGERPVRYAAMIASHDAERQLVVYWFQAVDRTASDTLSQKLTLWRRRLANQGQANAFVRVSCTMNGLGPGTCQETIDAFIHRFYPVFLDYMRQSPAKHVAASNANGRIIQ
jgi:EpsI family protein